MNFQFGRVKLVAETQVRTEPVFDIAFIGHLHKHASLSRLFSNVAMLDEIRNAGYREKLDELQKKYLANQSVDDISDPLFNLPIPLRSLDEFQELFSIDFSIDQDWRYTSRLAGSDVWLPFAVADFFQSEAMRVPRRLWIIPVDERATTNAFLAPDAATIPSELEDNALLRALSLPRLAYLAMPDFERLLIPQSLKPVPMLRIVNPVPNFLPCSTSGDDGVKERNTDATPFVLDETNRFIPYLKNILRVLDRFRPDVNLLMSFPYDEVMDGELPKISQLNQKSLQDWRVDSDSRLLRHVQLLYPYLQDLDGQISSSTGLLAGKILSTSTARGTWWSVAGNPLLSYKRPFPNLSNKVTYELREQHGLGVLQFMKGQLQLDDERLSVNYFADEPASNSAEFARFMGWLYRSLENLGFNLVFESQDIINKSEILLSQFFGRLYEMGALRGKNIEDAFSLSSSADGDGTVIIEIGLAPAFAIDSITLDFRYENGSLMGWEASNA